MKFIAAVSVAAVVGSAYGFLVVATTGIAMLVASLILIPFAAAASIPKVPLGSPSALVGAVIGVISGYLAEWIWFEFSQRLRCSATPGCNLITTPVQDGVWALVFLAVPSLVLGSGFIVRAARKRGHAPIQA